MSGFAPLPGQLTKSICAPQVFHSDSTVTTLAFKGVLHAHKALRIHGMQGTFCRALWQKPEWNPRGRSRNMDLILRTLAKMEEEREGSEERGREGKEVSFLSWKKS